MATRRTSSRSSAPPEPRPLIETDSASAIRLIESQFTKLEKLDANDRASVEEAQNYILADVGRVFGTGSAEWSLIWQNPIIKEPEYLGGDYEDDFDEASWHKPDKAKKLKAGIDEMLPRIRRLIDRARELAPLHAPRNGGDLVNPFNVLPHENLILHKAGGEQKPFRALWSEGCVTVHDARFPVAVGDTIERRLPNGIVERHEVVKVRFEKGMHSIPDAYHLDLSNLTAQPKARPEPVVHHNTTYNINGIAAAVGPGAIATGNTIIGQATQWNGVDRDCLADELAKLRSALVAEAGEDDDAAADGPVGEATKALKAGDQAGFFGAFKRFGSKAWAIAQGLGLAYLDYVGREKLGLPPPGGT